MEAHIRNNLSDEGKKFVIGTREGLFLEAFPPERSLINPVHGIHCASDQSDKAEYSEETIKMMHDEYSSLRIYLAELRTCQTTFFWSSIAALGTLSSVSAALVWGTGQVGATKPVVFVISLVSLLIVCPVWSIWFLKASSITRIAGYLRVLEDIISGREKKYKYIGWENSYFIYRRSLLKSYKLWRDMGTYLVCSAIIVCDSLREIFLALLLILKFEKPYQYNILTWLSFALIALSYVFVAMSVFEWPKNFSMKCLVILPFISVIFTTLYTSGVLSALSINQSRSMATRERLWRYLLDKRMFLEDGKHFLIHEREKENELIDSDKRKLINSIIVNYCNKKAENEAR